MSEWVMDPLTGNRMRRGASPAQHVVKGDVDTLTRESGQNSRDQKSGNKPVKLVYTLIELTGMHKAAFLDALGWNKLRKHLEACASDPGETGPRMRRGLSLIDSETPLRCLRIDDFGTRGLQGGDFETGKNFNLLCRAEFKTSSESGRGGSYGLGKAVLWRFSAIATVMLSSIVEGSEKKGIRIFGRTDIPSHTLPSGPEYQSGGWFGEKKNNETDSTAYAELVFGNATLAKSLLIDRASSASSGTSALIVGFDEPDQDQIRKLTDIANDIVASAARWFWPSMTGANPSMEVEVVVEKNGVEEFRKAASARPMWEPFIRAREAEASGATAKSSVETAELSIPFKVPARELPAAQAHPEIPTTLKLRVTRGDETTINHEKANCVAVFRGAEMVVKYVQAKREPLDGQPFFGVLMAGTVAGLASEMARAEEFFRASEPPLHNEWEYTEAIKHAYKQGAKVRLSQMWGSLLEKVFGLIDENVTPKEKGPELLAKLFPFGQSHKLAKKQTVRTEITKTSYRAGKWTINGEVTRVDPNSKDWEVRIGFVAKTELRPWRVPPDRKACSWRQAGQDRSPWTSCDG